MGEISLVETKSTSMAETKQEVMEKVGATRVASLTAVVDGLSATKMTIDKYGEEHIEPDHNIRLKSAEMIARMNGDIKPDGTISNTQVNIACSSAEIKELMEFVNGRRVGSVRGQQSGEIIDVHKYKA